MKSWKFSICVGLALFALFLALTFMAYATTNSMGNNPDGIDIYGIHYYNNMVLTPSGAQGDCYASNQYNSAYLSITTGFSSASPSGYTLAVGYVYNPYDWGSAQYWTLTSPGTGPTSGQGPVYGVWGNLGSVSETVQGYIVYQLPNPP